MDLRGKRVVVVGLAQTGVAVARFCAARGARVTATDRKPLAELGDAAAALDGVVDRLEVGGHDEASFRAADLVVMSPGVPELPETRAARAAGVEVIAEIELAYRFLHPDAPLIAITGTNGKSTTTALAGALCAASGRPTFCGGNLGNMPLIDAVDSDANRPGGLIVAEVAGFMLEFCTSFRPRVAACLNITPDHLDRYGTLERYASMKTRVFRWQTRDDVGIANANCPLTVDGLRQSEAQPLVFSSTGEVDRGACIAPGGDAIALRLPGGGEERYPLADLPLVGRHNVENAMAAYLAARVAGVPPDAVRAGARAFRPQPHRMELVGRRGDILYYDDSKGTNVAAVAASLAGFPRPVVLIAGGVDKGGSYEPLLAALDDVCKGLVLLGEAAPLIRAAAEEHGARYPIVDAADMRDAVVRATELADGGDAVVLSPACASYDMFRNFAERGHAFRAALAAVGAEPVLPASAQESP
ncbi:MAG: UDP-N-acetylmuramoyl-L-alanine--D-glutamate ligase [Deltaproteobacteria bacterium]|nr:MAG: UDP-N-acetylmuramoyl-L-alanine--D-glutamate ligase [Deltaproteobacteria bacterium]